MSHTLGFRGLLITVVTVGIFLLVTVMAGTTAWIYSDQLQDELRLQGSQLVQRVENETLLDLLSGNVDHATLKMSNLLSIAHVAGVALVDAETDTVWQVGVNPLLDHSHPRSDSLEFIEDGNIWTIVQPVLLHDQTNEFIDVDAQFFEDSEQFLTSSDQAPIGYAFVTLSTDEMQDSIKQILTIIFIVGLIIASVVVSLMLVAINRLATPLSNLADNMRSIEASGEFQHISQQGPKEYRQIAYVFNRMISTLEERDMEIRQHRDQLEAQVEIRTQELKQARDSALRASRHKSEFLANISHELRTPLNAIMGFCELIREELQDDGIDKHTDDLNQITRSSHHLLELINNLLDLAKVESGKHDVKLDPVAIVSLVSDSINTIRILFEANGNTLDINLPKRNIVVMTDAQKLRQILLNLLSNANKFTKNGTIGVNVNLEHAGRMVVRIADTGPGIAPEMHEQIFEQFKQSEHGNDIQTQGTGLGLAICRQFCRILGGDIYIDSTVTIGTTVVVDIPVEIVSGVSEKSFRVNQDNK